METDPRETEQSPDRLDLEPLTARRLEDFELCPQKLHLARLSWLGPQPTRRINAASALHAALRAALREVYLEGGPGPQALERAEAAFNEAFSGEACADSFEEERSRSRGKAILAGYLDDPAARVSGEVRVEVELQGELAGRRLTARADRLETSEAAARLVVYSSSRKPPTPGPLKRDLRTGILQLVAGQCRPNDAIRCEVHVLRQPRALEATKDAEEVEALRERASDLIRQVTEAVRFPIRKGSHCRWCRSKPICSAWA